MKKVLLIPAFILCINTALFAQCNSWIEASTISYGQGAWGVTTDAGNNVYSTGSFNGSIHFGSDSLVNNTSWAFSYYVNKFNSKGTIQWAVQFETPPTQNFPPVLYQKNGALYVAGVYYDTLVTNVSTNAMITNPGNNFFLLKLDLTGNLIWAKTYNGSLGAIFYNEAFGITINNLGQVYFTGQYADTIHFGSNVFIIPYTGGLTKREVFLTKTDSDGNVIWAKQSSTTSSNPRSRGWGITTDKDGNVILAGAFNDNITFGSQTFSANNNTTGYIFNPYLAKFDSAGNCQWVNGGQGPLDFSVLYDVVTDRNSNIYFTGIMDSNITYSGQALLKSNGVFYYGKYTPAGNLDWIKQTGNTIGGQQTPSSYVIDDSAHLWMSGWVYPPTNLGNFSLTKIGVFIAKLDTSGNILNVLQSYGTGQSYSSALDPDGNLYVGCTGNLDTLTFNGVTVFDPHVDSISSTDVIFKYCNSTTGIPQLSANNNQLSIYPNPTNGIITITSTKNIDEVKVTNLLGQTVLESASVYLGAKQAIDLSKFSDGMYFVTATSDDENETGKIILIK